MDSQHIVCIRIMIDRRNVTILATMTGVLYEYMSINDTSNDESNQFFGVQVKQQDDKATD